MYSKYIHPNPILALPGALNTFIEKAQQPIQQGESFCVKEIAWLWLSLALGVLVGIEATWERHLLIFIKSSSLLDHISA